MILVDALTGYDTKMRHTSWCHMVSDHGEAELHAFAARLGLKREWAQLRPAHSMAHYDLIPGVRSRAVAMGAREVTGRELVMRNYDGTYRVKAGLCELPSTEHPLEPGLLVVACQMRHTEWWRTVREWTNPGEASGICGDESFGWSPT